MGGPLRNIPTSHAGSYLNTSSSERAFGRFQKNVSQLRTQLNNGGVKDILHSFHRSSVLLVEMNKTFNIDNKDYNFPFALHIAEFDGHVWVGLDDVVVRESNGVSETILLKPGIGIQVLPLFKWPWDNFSTPLEPEMVSLYQWDIVRWAMHRKDKILGNIRQIVLPNTEILIKFLNEDKPNTLVGTRLNATASQGTSFATVSKLREKVGNKHIEVLPTISHLRFAKQLDKDFLPLRLQLGQGYNAEHVLCHIWIYFKLVSGVCPRIDIVLGGPIYDEDDENLDSPEQSHQVSYTLETISKMLQDGDMKLLRVFQPLQNVNEMKTFAKFCFILATEDPLYTFINHFIPFNKTFADHLEKVCERFSTVTSDFYTDSTSPPLVQSEEPECRGTFNNILAAYDDLSFLPDDHAEAILEQDTSSQSSSIIDTHLPLGCERHDRSKNVPNERPATGTVGSISNRKTHVVARDAAGNVPNANSAIENGNSHPRRYSTAAKRPVPRRLHVQTARVRKNKALVARLKQKMRRLQLFIQKVPSHQEALRKCRQRYVRELKMLDRERIRVRKAHIRELKCLLTVEPSGS